jgi:N4-(beta-N-acetylglucosaminyl)-L-asparaginase
MSHAVSRREFVVSSALAGASLSLPATVAGAPNVRVRRARPIVIASANGYRSRDSDGTTCIEKAFELITAGGDVLDALIAGVNIVELDPEDSSVG